MLRSFAVLSLIGILCLPCQALALERLRLATTTSTENSGLLDLLLPPFEAAQDCHVDVIAVGTGKALKLGETGDVDVVLVHARAQEEAFVAAGFGVARSDVMYNDFVVLGPATDPAGLRGDADVTTVFARIAASTADFISRGDESGTHFRERQLWREAGVTPEGSWYLEAGRGMGEVLVMANERMAYTLCDRGTYLAFKDKLELEVILSGDRRLFNAYGVIPVNPAQQPHVNYLLAKAFCDYLVSAPARALISGFRKSGEQLFFVAQ